MTSATNPTAVVVGIDGSDSALDGARWAATFATGRALPLTLLHAIPTLDWHFTRTAGSSELDERVTATTDQALSASETALKSEFPGLAVHTEAVKGGVATVLADASASAQLLVIGAGAADHRALGGHAVRVMHRAQCPVLVWRRPVAHRTGKPLPVVVGIDESDASARTLAEAFAIAQLLHAPVMVVHMWDIGAAVGMGDLGGQGNMDWPLLELLQTQQRQKMDELVAPFAAKYPNSHVSKVFQDVSPARGLTDLSREAQLVVVGSHGRGKVAGAILGSVSQNLIHHAECPVLVVR